VFHAERLAFVERMSDEELGNLVSAVGNSESKANALRCMEPGVYIVAECLRRHLQNLKAAISQEVPNVRFRKLFDIISS